MTPDDVVNQSCTYDVLNAVYTLVNQYHHSDEIDQPLKRVVIDLKENPVGEPVDFIVYIHEACRTMIIQPVDQHLRGDGCPICNINDTDNVTTH